MALGALLVLAAGAVAKQAVWRGLRDDEAGAYSWSVAAASEERGTACLKVAILHRHGRFAYDRSKFRRCATGLKAKGPPLIVGGTELSGERAGMTVLALAFAPGVDHARVQFAGQDPAAISPRPLRGAVRRSGLPAPRYAVFAIRGRRCLTRVVSLDAGGNTLWASKGDRCLPDHGAGE
jgi:hypothetical protein